MATNRWRFVIELADQGWVVRGFVGIIAVPSTAQGAWARSGRAASGWRRSDGPAVVGIGSDGLSPNTVATETNLPLPMLIVLLRDDQGRGIRHWSCR